MKYVEIKKGMFASKDFSVIVEKVDPELNSGNKLRIKHINGCYSDIPQGLDWFLDNFADEIRFLNGKRVKIYRDEK